MKHVTDQGYNVPSKDDLRWFAGYFDGEGSVTLHRQKRKDGGNAYELMLQVAGTHLPTADRVQGMWDFGSINPVGGAGNRVASWHWVVYGHKAWFVLEHIFFYLMTKRSDAEIGYRFQEWKYREAGQYGKSRRPEESYVKEDRFKELLAKGRQGGVESVSSEISGILGYMVESMPRPKLNREDKVHWFAGFFDAEGSVMFREKPRGDMLPSYKLLLQVGGTHLGTISSLGTIRGTGTFAEVKDKRQDRQRIWRWTANGETAADILETIYPYIITKRADAKICMAYQNWKAEEAKTLGRTRKRPEEHYAKGERFKRLLAEHRQGDVATVDAELQKILCN